MANTYIVLTGPTAAGKTAWLAHFARQRRMIVVSADSRQVYRRMDIGTGKPTLSEQEIIPHYGVDILEPGISYSVYQFLTIAAQAFLQAEHDSVPVWVCGGAGLYIRALTERLELGARPRSRLRAALQRRIDELGPAKVASDLGLAVRDPQNQRRVLRAAENTAGNPARALGTYRYAGLTQAEIDVDEISLQSTSDIAHNSPHRPACLGSDCPGGHGELTEASAVLARWDCAGVAVLDPGKETLASRIDRRVRGMFGAGLAEELLMLRRLGYGSADQVANGIAYREAGQLLDGLLTEEQAIQQAIIRTKQYAKRQRTYFRGRGWPLIVENDLAAWAVNV